MENLPFDSLYKFLTGAGIALTVACGGAYYHEERSIAIAKAEQSARDEVNNLHLDTNNARIIELARSERRGPDVTSEVEGLIIDNEKRLGEMGSNFIESRKTDAQKKLFEGRFWYFVGGMGSGIFVLSIGFVFWFYKLQRHIDKQVKRGQIPG